MIVVHGAVKAALRRGAAAVAALAVCACASQEKPKAPEENIYPSDYKAQVAALVRRMLDSGNVRDASIAEPVLKTSLTTPRYVACVRFNTADSGVASKGSKLYAAYFYAGKITQIVEAKAEQCDKAAFLPFPELQ